MRLCAREGLVFVPCCRRQRQGSAHGRRPAVASGEKAKGGLYCTLYLHLDLPFLILIFVYDQWNDGAALGAAGAAAYPKLEAASMKQVCSHAALWL